MPLQSLDFATPALLAIGLLLFLFGMRQLETGIRSLGYTTFKRWLSSTTASAAGSAGIGAMTTAILQSSSMVSLLVLAFASAGALPLYNAVGMILGANLGTTVTGWMVATIGFKLSLQVLALPLMAGGGLLQLLSTRASKLMAPGIVIFGLGMIIFGLDIMKEAVSELPSQWNLGALKGQGAWVYFLAGAVIAAIIQSSSATMMMTLAALHGGLLDLSAAAALVIGADLGTTSTTALGSIGGHFIKRQLALAHVLFNITVDLAAFFFLLPLLPALLELLSLRDPLYSLVAFHSIFNLLGLLIFLPMLKSFSNWIGRRFRTSQQAARPLAGVPVDVPDAALVATATVLADMRINAAALNLHAFLLRPEELHLEPALLNDLNACFDEHIATDLRYDRLKQQESDLLEFFTDMQKQVLSAEQVAMLERQVREARALVYSSKTLNDIRQNLISLRHSQHEEMVSMYKNHRKFVQAFYHRYMPLASGETASQSNERKRATLLEENRDHYRQANEAVTRMASSDIFSGIELSTMLNVNHEIHHSVKNLVSALVP